MKWYWKTAIALAFVGTIAMAAAAFGQSDPGSKFITPGDGPLVQIPHTGVIWKICKQ